MSLQLTQFSTTYWLPAIYSISMLCYLLYLFIIFFIIYFLFISFFIFYAILVYYVLFLMLIFCLYFHTKVQKYLHTFYATLVNFTHSPKMWGKRRACIVITILINMNNLHSLIIVVQRYKGFKCTQVQVNSVVNTSVHIVTTEYLTCMWSASPKFERHCSIQRGEIFV